MTGIINFQDQGTLNRLLTNIVVPNFPQLNVVVANLGKRAVSITFEGATTTSIPTQTGIVQSPEPYQPVRIAINLLKSQGYASLWRAQLELSTLIGPISVYLDSPVLSKYNFYNGAIVGVPELTGAGTDADYQVLVTAIYPINAALW